MTCGARTLVWQASFDDRQMACPRCCRRCAGAFREAVLCRAARLAIRLICKGRTRHGPQPAGRFKRACSKCDENASHPSCRCPLPPRLKNRHKTIALPKVLKSCGLGKPTSDDGSVGGITMRRTGKGDPVEVSSAHQNAAAIRCAKDTLLPESSQVSRRSHPVGMAQANSLTICCSIVFGDMPSVVQRKTSLWSERNAANFRRLFGPEYAISETHSG